MKLSTILKLDNLYIFVILDNFDNAVFSKYSGISKHS